MSASRDPWLETRTSLLQRLRDRDDARSWEQFCDVYGRVIHAVAIRAGLTREDAEDVAQETLVALARQIAEFRYDRARGSFRSWLLTIARRRIADVQRRHHRDRRFDVAAPEDSSETGFLERVADERASNLDALFEEEWRRGLYAAAVERVRGTSSPRQFQIFDLCVTKEWSVERVAERLKATTNQIYVAKHRVSGAIAAEVERLAAGELG